MKLYEHLAPHWRHLLFINYLLLMLVVFLTPTPDTGIEWTHLDKAIHLVLFFGFAIVYHLDRAASPKRVFFVSVLFAGGIELAQWVLPFRSLEFADFAAGVVGAGSAAILMIVRAGQITRPPGRSDI